MQFIHRFFYRNLISSSGSTRNVNQHSSLLFSTIKKHVFPQHTNNDNGYETIKTKTKDDHIIHVTLNRPDKGNAFNIKMWEEYTDVFSHLNSTPSARVCILSGEGKHFSTGMDLSVFAEMNAVIAQEKCEGRRREGVYRFIQFLQDAVSAPEKCKVPVIAAISGHCIGGAIDLVTACDLRYCTKDSTFSIKETDLGMVADIGTLQRLPKLISEQRTRELAYTGRTFKGEEAVSLGLVLDCFETKEAMDKHVVEVARNIASKSPLTVRGIKSTLLHARDHSVSDSLQQVKLWNAAFLYSDDLAEAMKAATTRTPPKYN